MQYAEKCSQPYDFQICIIHLFLQGKLNNCTWSFLCISSLSCSALLPCWEPHREQTPLLWQLIEAWLWKFCLFGFFSLIYDSFSALITPQKNSNMSMSSCCRQEKPLTWAHHEFSFLCPGKCSHSLGVRLPTLLKEGNLQNFQRKKSRTVKKSMPTGKGSQGQHRSPKLSSSWALLCAHSHSLHAGPFLQHSLGFGSEKPFLAIKV